MSKTITLQSLRTAFIALPKSMGISKPVVIHAAMISVGFICGVNFNLVKIAVPAHISPIAIMLFRTLGGGLVFWLLHTLAIKEKLNNKKDLFRLGACALFGVVLNTLSFFKGITLTTPINASILGTITPVLVLMLAAIFLKERITLLKLTGLALGISGAVLLLGGKGFTFSSHTFWGDLLSIANACFYGLYLILLKPITKTYHPLTIVKWTFLFGALMVFPIGYQELMSVEWSSLPSSVWLVLLYNTLGSIVLVYLLNGWALQFVNPSVVGIYVYLQPLVATVVATMLGKDVLTPEKLFFGLLIFGGVFLVSKKNSGKRDPN